MRTALKDAESCQVLMCPSRSPHVRLLAQQMSRRHSASRQEFCSITGVTVSHAAVIQRRSSSTSCNFVWYTKSFIDSHRNKSKGVKYGNLSGHAIGTPLPNPLAWKLLIKKSFMQSHEYHKSASSRKLQPIHITPN
jgi:hypothetical protein